MSGERQTPATEEKERKKVDLKIELEDFGPISSGQITLRPLTVFIGPNNSGKSYTAMLVYSIFESYATAASSGVIHSLRHIDVSPLAGLKKQLADLREGNELDIPGQSMEALSRMALKALYQEMLSSRIAHSFNCSLDELIRIGKNAFALKINHEPYGIHLAYQKGKLGIREYPQLDIKVRVAATWDHSYTIRYISKEGDEEEPGFLLRVNPSERKNAEDAILRLLLDSISNMCALKILEARGVQCRYLPAGKSHMLQISKAFVTDIVREISRPGIEKLDIPRISGVVSQFILSVLNLPQERGTFYRFAQDFEKELIAGEIVVSNPDKHLYPEIKYSFQDTEIPLHRSSSTVSELAPLFLYLRYIVEPSNILIIEEPEAHLHPGNQRILARLLVRLVREGVNLIITTHSEYLLEQLSNFIILSKVEPQRRVEKYKYSRQDYLEHGEVAAYVFGYDEESAGHKIAEVEITEEDGISDEEFARIYEALYEETIKLRGELSDEA